MRADIHYGREQLPPLNGPNTDARDQSSPDHHIQLATHGRSIQMCHGLDIERKVLKLEEHRHETAAPQISASGSKRCLALCGVTYRIGSHSVSHFVNEDSQ